MYKKVSFLERFFKKMAEKRFISTRVWRDERVVGMTPTQKLVWVYLISSPEVSTIGIIQLSKRTVQFDLGISMEEVNDALNYLSNQHMIAISDITDEIALLNSIFNNAVEGWVYERVIAKELRTVYDRKLLIAIYENGNNKIATLPKSVQPFMEYLKNPDLIDGLSEDMKVKYQERKAKKVVKMPNYGAEDDSKKLSEEEVNEILERRRKRDESNS